MLNHQDLAWQWEWAGARLQNLRILVCSNCYDKPQEQLRDRVLSPDPLPIYNARPEPFYPSGVGQEQTGWITAENGIDPQGFGTLFTMEDGSTLITTEGTNTQVTTGGS
jgi:hypothetical protein